MTSSLFQLAHELKTNHTPFVIVTLTGIRGEAPSDLGNKILVTREGRVDGTVGGGKVEARAIAYSQELLKKPEAFLETVTWNLQTDIGMTCGGEVTFVFEPFHHRPWRIAVFGAGHVSQSVIRTLLPLQCQIDCFDSRSEWVERLPQSGHLRIHSLEAVDSFLQSCSPETFFLSITQGHATDVPILDMVFRRFPEPAYIGVIGSKVKGGRIRKDLLERGIPASSLELLRCPVGLDFGTNDPPEIAISIVAEMLSVRDKLRS